MVGSEGISKKTKKKEEENIGKANRKTQNTSKKQKRRCLERGPRGRGRKESRKNTLVTLRKVLISNSFTQSKRGKKKLGIFSTPRKKHEGRFLGGEMGESCCEAESRNTVKGG